MKYTHLIDENILQSLRCLINRKINSIYGSAFSVHKNYIETQAFILKLGNELWLNFGNEAKETPENNDYYKFLITSDSVPMGVAYDKEKNSFIYPFSKVSFTPTIINSIEIYNRNEIYNGEELNYDALILFNCEKKTRFIIALEERVDEFLVYSSDNKIINKYLNGLECRTKLS